MKRITRTENTGKKGDYWYIDRHAGHKSGTPLKGVRILGLVFAIALAVYCAACSAGMNPTMQTMQESYQESYGGDTTGSKSNDYWYYDNADMRQASDVTESDVTESSDELSVNSGSPESTDNPVVHVDIKGSEAEPLVMVQSNEQIIEIELVFDDGSSSIYDELGGNVAKVDLGDADASSEAKHKGKGKGKHKKHGKKGTSGLLDVVTDTVATSTNVLVGTSVTLADGSKWYFDNSTTYASFGVVVGRDGVVVKLDSATESIASVSLYAANGSSKSGMPDGNGKLSFSSVASLSYLAVTLKSGSKWFFDRAGLPLPGGYKPRINATWLGQALSLTSSDVYDNVAIYYSDYSKSSFGSNGLSGTYLASRGKVVDGFRVRLKSDGSKWYFDNAGLPIPCDGKWFADVD